MGRCMVGARGGGISSHAKFYGPCEDYIILKFVSTMNYCWVGFFLGGGGGLWKWKSALKWSNWQKGARSMSK